MNIKTKILFLLPALLTCGCASTQQENKPAFSWEKSYCDDGDVLVAYFTPDTYLAVNRAVQEALLDNGFYPAPGQGKFLPTKTMGKTVRWLSIKGNEGIEISLDGKGTTENSIRAPQSIEFETQTICSESYERTNEIRDTVKKITVHVLKSINDHHIQVVPKLKNEEAIQHM